MSYYENRIKALEERVAEMARDQRMKAIPVEAKLVENIARLQAEVERLTIERNGFEQAMKANQSILETKRDTIDRLLKAGDAMASSIQFNEEMAKDYNGPTIVHQCVKRWNAAKEGKPIA